MRCRGLLGVANPAFLEGFPFSALPCVAPYCAPGGIRVVSMSSAPLASTKGSLYWEAMAARLRFARSHRRSPPASGLAQASGSRRGPPSCSLRTSYGRTLQKTPSTRSGSPDLSGVVLPSVETTSDSSIVVPPGLVLALSLAQCFSSIEALVKVGV
jgi:hypothetical protein